MPHFATEFTLPLLSGLVVFPALLKVCLLRAVFADVSSLPTMKTFSLLSFPLSTILGYVPFRTTKIAFPFFLSFLIITVTILSCLTIIRLPTLRLFRLLVHVEEEE